MKNIKNNALGVASVAVLIAALNVTGVFGTFFSDKNDAPAGSVCGAYGYQAGYGYGYDCAVPHNGLGEAKGMNNGTNENDNQEKTNNSDTNNTDNSSNTENNNSSNKTDNNTEENNQESTTENKSYDVPKKFSSCMIIKNILDPNYMSSYVNPFVDINNSPYKNTIISFAKVGIVHGTTPTTFEPNRGITRAEFLAIVIKTHCYNFDLGSNNPGFPDVDPTTWQAKVVKKGVALGIIHGYSDGTFKPNRVISKAEAYGIVSSIGIKNSKLADKTSYTDLEAKWQENLVRKLELLGIINPKADNYKFHPNSAVNRDQMLEFIRKVIALY